MNRPPAGQMTTDALEWERASMKRRLAKPDVTAGAWMAERLSEISATLRRRSGKPPIGSRAKPMISKYTDR